MTRSESERLTSALLYAVDCIRYYESVSTLPDCNTCKKQRNCEYSPRIGDYTRINCPLHEKGEWV